MIVKQIISNRDNIMSYFLYQLTSQQCFNNDFSLKKKNKHRLNENATSFIIKEENPCKLRLTWIYKFEKKKFSPNCFYYQKTILQLITFIVIKNIIMKTKLNLKQSISTALIAALLAASTNSILFFIFHKAAIITDDIFVGPNMPMSVLPIIIASVIPTIIAGFVFFLLEKYTNNGFKIFTILSIIILIFSFSNPFMMIPGVTLSYGLALCVMHIVVIAFLLYFLNRSKNKNIV